MRLFAAIDIPHDIQAALDSFLKALMPSAKLNWSRVENLHITTQFIGEWPDVRLDEMKRALAAVPFPRPIDVSVEGIGWFPNERRPRVFWAGVEGGDSLRTLARLTAEALANLGVTIEDRVYSPHLTLARIREAVPLADLHKALASFAARSGFDFGAFRADRFFLYLSAGGKYTQLAEFPFA